MHLRANRIVCALLCCVLAMPAVAQREPFVEFSRVTAAAPAEIEIDAARPAPFVVPPTMFGTFTENIWDAVYGGVWSQVLHNPSFEPDYLSASNMIDAARYSRLVTDPSFGSGYVRVEPLVEPKTVEDRDRFVRSSALGLPVPWEPLRAAGVRYEPRDNDATNSNRSLLIMGLAGREVGVRQGVYLPTHRTLRYTGTLWTKMVESDPRPIGGRLSIITLSLRRRDKPDEIIAQTVLRPEPLSFRTMPDGETLFADQLLDRWTKRDFVLDVPRDKTAPLEKVDFCISVDDERRILVDDVRLFPADHVEGFDPEVIRLAKEMRTPLLRFGGNFVSGYHWQDGVGSQDKRRTILNQAWGLPEYNHFGTDEFIRLCRLIGAEPQISVNAGSGTPAEAAAWVEYCNGSPTSRYGSMRAANGHKEPYNVRLWEIGNELWGDFQIGWQTARSNARRYNEFAAAMRSVDPTVRLIATGADIDFYRDWNKSLIDLAGANLDSVSTHLVIGMQPGEQVTKNADDAFTHRADFAVPVAVGRKLDEMRAQFDSDPRTKNHTKIAFTEWQFWSPRAEDPRFTNLGGAVNAAAFFNMMIRRADFVPVSNMSNLVQFAGIHRQRGRTFVTPSYHVFRFYSDAVGWRPLPLRLRANAYDVRGGNRRAPDVPEVPEIDALALLSPDGGRLRLYLVNRILDRELETGINVRGFAADARLAVVRLHGAGIDAANTPENSAVVEPTEIDNVALSRVRLPAHSITRIELAARVDRRE